MGNASLVFVFDSMTEFWIDFRPFPIKKRRHAFFGLRPNVDHRDDGQRNSVIKSVDTYFDESYSATPKKDEKGTSIEKQTEAVASASTSNTINLSAPDSINFNASATKPATEPTSLHSVRMKRSQKFSYSYVSNAKTTSPAIEAFNPKIDSVQTKLRTNRLSLRFASPSSSKKSVSPPKTASNVKSNTKIIKFYMKPSNIAHIAWSLTDTLVPMSEYRIYVHYSIGAASDFGSDRYWKLVKTMPAVAKQFSMMAEVDLSEYIQLASIRDLRLTVRGVTTNNTYGNFATVNVSKPNEFN